jgi:hypothetical protein
MVLANCGLIKRDNLFRNVFLRSDIICRNNPKGQRIVKAVSHFSCTCKTVFNKSTPLKCFLSSPSQKTPRLKQVEFSSKFRAKNGFLFTVLITHNNFTVSTYTLLSTSVDLCRVKNTHM